METMPSATQTTTDDTAFWRTFLTGLLLPRQNNFTQLLWQIVGTEIQETKWISSQEQNCTSELQSQADRNHTSGIPRLPEGWLWGSNDPPL